jgi:hypothetical protein
MAIKSRGQTAFSRDIVQLRTVFRNPTTGMPVDLDFFPEVSIQQPSGNVVFGFSSLGVYRVGTGTYGFDYTVGEYPEIGVWEDNWRGQLGSFIPYNQHNFVVHNTQMPGMNSDGYFSLGDEPGFDFSQNAIKNINRLVWMLKKRLNSSGKAVIKDSYGNDQLVDCDIYTIDQLVTFLITALEMFNMIPHFTHYTFEDTQFFDVFGANIVHGALIWALSSKALIERGREFQITDNGTSFQPPGVSDILTTQYNTEYTQWKEDLKLIKQNMKPMGLGLGSMRPYQASPQLMRLRHLRERRWY